MSTNAIVVNIVLDGQNYPEWAFCVQTALRGHGLLFHLTEDLPVLAADRSNAAAIKTWQINDGKVMAAMVNSTKPTMVMSLSKFTIAKAIFRTAVLFYIPSCNRLMSLSNMICPLMNTIQPLIVL
jgi:hypothetical protein